MDFQTACSSTLFSSAVSLAPRGHLGFGGTTNARRQSTDSHDQSSGDENKITVVVCGSDEEDEEETASAPDDDSDEYDVDVGVAGRRSRRLIRSRGEHSPAAAATARRYRD